MNKKLLHILEIGCSGIIGIFITIGYQHFFSQPQNQQIEQIQEQTQQLEQEQTQNQSIIVNIDGKEVSYQSEDVKNLNDKSSELQIENDKLKTSNESLEIQITNLSNENSELHKQINELENRNENLTSIILEYQNNPNNVSNDLSQGINDDGEYRSFLSECMPYYKTNYVSIIENNIKMCGVAYSNGMKFACDGYYALFNLDGKYNKLKFDVGHVDNSAMSYGEIHIYIDNLDSNPVKIIPIEPDSLVESYEIDLNGGIQLKISTVADKKDIFVGIVNMEVK